MTVKTETERVLVGKVKVRTLDIAPLHTEQSPQKRSGIARVVKASHSFTCNRNEPYLPLPSQL